MDNSSLDSRNTTDLRETGFHSFTQRDHSSGQSSNLDSTPFDESYLANPKDSSNLELYLDIGRVKCANSGTRLYSCSQCSYRSRQKGTLKRHIRAVHLKLKPLAPCTSITQQHSCSQCSYKANHKWFLERHFRAVHLKLKPFACTHCDYRAAHKNDLERHIRVLHVTCISSDCEYMSSRIVDLNNHIKAVHMTSKPYKCSECKFSSIRKGEITKHNEQVKQHTCSECSYSTRLKYELERHIASVHVRSQHINLQTLPDLASLSGSSLTSCNDRSIVGPSTNIESISAIQLQSRTDCSDKATHKRTPKTFQLEKIPLAGTYLNNSATQKGDLHIHVKSNYKQVKTYKCLHCEFSATNKVHLDRHIKAVHLKLKPHKCSKCNFSSAWKQSLTMHTQAVHEQLREFKCTGHKRRLERHKQTVHFSLQHTNLKTVPDCTSFDGTNPTSVAQSSECGHQTLYENLLVLPLTSGMNQRLHSCSECVYRTVHKGALELHMGTVHQITRPFVCTQCSFRARYKYNLALHIQLVHLPRISRKEYNRHAQSVHTNLRHCNSQTALPYCIPIKRQHPSNCLDASNTGTISNASVSQTHYKCHECEYSFDKRELLDIHLRAGICELGRSKSAVCSSLNPGGRSTGPPQNNKNEGSRQIPCEENNPANGAENYISRGASKSNHNYPETILFDLLQRPLKRGIYSGGRLPTTYKDNPHLESSNNSNHVNARARASPESTLVNLLNKPPLNQISAGPGFPSLKQGSKSNVNMSATASEISSAVATPKCLPSHAIGKLYGRRDVFTLGDLELTDHYNGTICQTNLGATGCAEVPALPEQQVPIEHDQLCFTDQMMFCHDQAMIASPAQKVVLPHQMPLKEDPHKEISNAHPTSIQDLGNPSSFSSHDNRATPESILRGDNDRINIPRLYLSPPVQLQFALAPDSVIPMVEIGMEMEVEMEWKMKMEGERLTCADKCNVKQECYID